MADKNIQKKDIKAISLKLIDDFLYIVNIKYMKNKGNEINRVYIYQYNLYEKKKY